MNTKSTALQLAEYLELPHIGQNKSAAELRRLHEENQALRQALAEPEDPRIVELRTLMAEPTVTGVIFEVHRGPLSKSIREYGDCPCPTHVEGDVRIEVKDEHEHVLDCPRCGHCCPERKWVGLTDDEIDTLANDHLVNVQEYIGMGEYISSIDGEVEFARAIEEKLKEKNGG